MIKQLQKQIIRYLAFIVGTGQLVLSEENKAYWMFIQTIGDIQILSLLFVMNVSQHVRNINILKYLTLPTTILIESLDDHVVALTVLMFIISIMHLVNLLLIVQQSSNYQRQKESRRNLASDSMQLKYEKLTKIYGYSDYMNIWFQLNIKSKSSTLHLTKLVAHWFHVYNIIINKPVALYAFYVMVNGSTEIESVLAAVLLGLNALNFVMCYNIQLIALTVNGSNFLRLKCSHIYSFEQFVEHIIIVWVVVDVQQAIVPVALLTLVFILNLAEFFYSMPFIEDYKRFTTITTNCTCLVIALTELNFNLGAQIQLTLIIAPFLVRILDYIAYYQLYYLITKYLIPEKLLTDLTGDSNITNTKGINENYIKSIMHKVKIYAIGQLQHHSFTYFPQLLKLVNISSLRDKQILMINPEVPQQITPIVSKLLFHAGLLFHQHSSNCQSIYCYCRGFKGEALKGSQGSVNIRKMFSNQDLEISSINIYADLIHRYIRNYCKSVFKKYQTKQDLIYLIQLVSYQADSEECIQSIVTLMDLLSKLAITKKKLTWFEQIAIGITTQFVQFSIVVKQNNAITPSQMDTTFKYEFFRAVYKKSLKIFRKLADCIKAKQVYFTNLNYQQSYETMEGLIQELNEVNKSTLEALQKFMLRTQSKTALLCSLVFEFEIRNNYNNADKIVQQLKGKESDFFEYPDIHYEVEENSVEICFMRVDLGCAALKDQYNGTKRGWIRDFSRSAPNFFKYNDSEFKQLRNIVQLMPYSTQRIHDNFIDLFLLTSRPAVIRAHIPVWAKSKYDELIVTEFFIDFDFKFPNGQLTIYVFLKKIKNTTSAGRLKQYFWVDSEGNLEAVSQNVPSTFKINDPDKQWLYNQVFSTLMPEFAEVQIELNQQLEVFLQNEEENKGKISESNSRTMESLQIVHSKFLKNTSLQFPKELMVGDKEQNYLVDCKIYFKQAYLIGRLYKIYLIEIENYQVDQTDIIRKPKVKQSEQAEIPNEFESEDYRLLDILGEKLQISNPDNSLISENLNSSSEEQAEVQQVIQFDRNFQFEQQITFNQNNYEKYQKEDYLEIRHGGQLATQRQQLYFSDNLLVQNNTINKSVSQTIDKGEIIKENIKARDQLLIMNENQSQSSQATTQGKFKILSKSTLYSQFAESQQVPTSVTMIMALNIFTLLTLLTLITVSLSILKQSNHGRGLCFTSILWLVIGQYQYSSNVKQQLLANKFKNDPLCSTQIIS